MDYPPDYVRDIAVAVGIVRDEQGRVLLIQHPHRHHLWFPSGHMKELDSKTGAFVDIVRILPAMKSARFFGQLLKMKKEHRRAATRREVYEELAEEMDPPIVDPITSGHGRRSKIRFAKDYPVVKLFNQCDDGTWYKKPIITETAIFASETILPRHWMDQLRSASLTDPRVCFAPESEIRQKMAVAGLRRISPDVERVLVRTGFIGP